MCQNNSLAEVVGERDAAMVRASKAEASAVALKHELQQERSRHVAFCAHPVNTARQPCSWAMSHQTACWVGYGRTRLEARRR